MSATANHDAEWVAKHPNCAALDHSPAPGGFCSACRPDDLGGPIVVKPGYERILPFDHEPERALSVEEVGDMRCGCEVFLVTLARRSWPAERAGYVEQGIIVECHVCGASWVRRRP
jgi:hypothetical protein